MKKTIITAALVLGFSGGVYAQSAIKQLAAASGLDNAAGVSADLNKSLSAVVNAAGERELPQPHNGFQPGHPQPGPNPGHPQPGPNPGWNGHDGEYHPQQPDQFHSTGYNPDCRTWEFTSQTSNNRTEDLMVTETGNDCHYVFDPRTHQQIEVCEPSSKTHLRNITVTILGDRKLEDGEMENLKVCLTDPYSATVDTGDMLYNYTVESQDTSDFWTQATTFHLTPGDRKPAKPDPKELSVKSVGTDNSGSVRLVLNDLRADYFKGGKITISVEGMRIPTGAGTATGGSVDDILNSLVYIKTQGTFDVAPSYDLKLLDKSKAGDYFVTIKFIRASDLSDGETASITKQFQLK